MLFWEYKKAQLGALGWDKVRFKFIHFYICTILHFSFTLLPSLSYATIKFLRLRKLNEFKVTGVYSRKAVHRKTTTRQFLIWWKSCISYCLYWQPSKGSCLSEICVSVDNICSNKLWRNAEERFCLEILSWGQCSGNKNKPPFND